MNKRDFAMKLLAEHAAQTDYTDDLLATKRGFPPEQQFEWLRVKTEQEIIARMEGISALLESTLMMLGLYAGFGYIAPYQINQAEGGTTYRSYTTVRLDDPRFAEWRRTYYLKPESQRVS